MEDYKVQYGQKGRIITTDWLDEKTARKMFDSLMSETVLITKWAELSVWSDEEDNMVVVKSFDRREMELLGSVMLMPLSKDDIYERCKQ